MLKFRHLKHVQYEMTRELLEQKRGVLEELERSELEAQRLERALERVRIVNDDGTTAERAVSAGSSTTASGGAGDGGAGTVPSSTSGPPVSIAAAPPPAPRKSTGGAGGLLGALSHTFHGIVDADPEAARRNNITKTREAINQVSRMMHTGPARAVRDSVTRYSVSRLMCIPLSYRADTRTPPSA